MIFGRKTYFELFAWVSGLILLALMNPIGETHYSFCLFKNLGIPFCPGCGLGHSISYLLHGEIRSSFNAHPLGIFAFIVILFRIFKLSLFHFYNQTQKNNYGQPL